MAITEEDKQAAAARREAALQRLRDITASNERYNQAQYNQAMAYEQQQQQQAADKISKEKLNWFDNAMSGAQAGSAAGPWGMLVGGILGTAQGWGESIKERQKIAKEHGKKLSGFDAFENTALDTPFGFNSAHLWNKALGRSSYGDDKSYQHIDPGQAGNFASSLYGGIKQQQANTAREQAVNGQNAGVSYGHNLGSSDIEKQLDAKLGSSPVYGNGPAANSPNNVAPVSGLGAPGAYSGALNSGSLSLDSQFQDTSNVPSDMQLQTGNGAFGQYNLAPTPTYMDDQLEINGDAGRRFGKTARYGANATPKMPWEQ